MMVVNSLLSERYTNVEDAQEMIGRKVLPYDPETHQVTSDNPMPVVDVFALMGAGIPETVYRVEIDGLLTDCWGQALLDVETLIDDYLEAIVEYKDDPDEVEGFAESARTIRAMM